MDPEEEEQNQTIAVLMMLCIALHLLAISGCQYQVVPLSTGGNLECYYGDKLMAKGDIKITGRVNSAINFGGVWSLCKVEPEDLRAGDVACWISTSTGAP